MSDVDEPWWGDESPIGVERRGAGPVGDAGVPHAEEPYDDGAGRVGPGGSVAGRVGPGGSVAGRVGPSGSHRDDGSRDAVPDLPAPGPKRSSVQIFIPAPEDLPPFEEVVGPAHGGPPEPGATRMPDTRAVSGPRHVADPVPLGGIADAPPLPPVVAAPPRAAPDVPPAPDLARRARPRASLASSPAPRPPIDRRRLAVVYDIDGPHVRLGVAWFVAALVATVASPFTAAVVYAVAAGLAARQVVRAWGSVSWHADVATGLGAVPVLAALIGTPAVVATVAVALVVAIGAAGAPDGARMPGGGGRMAAMGILALSVVPAVAGATFVLVRAESVMAAVVLLLVASGYEMGDFIVGSGSSNPIEGPVAGITTATLVALPMALVLVEPFDAAGVGLLAFAAVACPMGQVVGSAVLPGAGADAPALRRIDTLLVLAPLWAAAAGAF